MAESSGAAGETSGVESPARATLLLFLGVTGFWLLFAAVCESFYRDDNLGGVAPILREAVRHLLRGEWPGHTYTIGGGGGAYVSLALNGLCDPFLLLPAILLRDSALWMCNAILALHLGVFAAGGLQLARALRAPRWAALVAALSLATSGFYVVWAGNWITVLVPYAFVPWLVTATLRIVDAGSRRELLVAEATAAASMAGVFGTGMPFAPMYGGLVVLLALLARMASGLSRADLRRVALRLAPQAALLLVLGALILGSQHRLYEFYGARVARPRDWDIFTVPVQAYLGLFVPTTYAVWKGPFFENGALYTNLLVCCGFVPAWTVLGTLFLRRQALLARPVLVLLGGAALFVLVLSPSAFGLQGAFAVVPVVRDLRWPLRALPAFHVLVVLLFLAVVTAADYRPGLLHRTLLLLACAGGSLVAYTYDLGQIGDKGPVGSWFRGAPMLSDPEGWSKETIEVLGRSGYVANVCSSEAVIHDKPRLFIYGNLAPDLGVRTVHLYTSPVLRAYRPLGMSIKGCLTNWRGVLRLIGDGPRVPPPGEQAWDDPRGPRTFDEIVAKTYVGAVIVDALRQEAMAYFASSPGWRLLENREAASVFVRR